MGAWCPLTSFAFFETKTVHSLIHLEDFFSSLREQKIYSRLVSNKSQAGSEERQLVPGTSQQNLALFSILLCLPVLSFILKSAKLQSYTCEDSKPQQVWNRVAWKWKLNAKVSHGLDSGALMLWDVSCSVDNWAKSAKSYRHQIEFPLRREAFKWASSGLQFFFLLIFIKWKLMWFDYCLWDGCI